MGSLIFILYIIMILKEEILNEIDFYISEAISVISEIEQIDDRNFVWDLTKEKLNKSTENIKTPTQAEEYLKVFLRKIKYLSKNLKVKLASYVISILLGFTAASAISNVISQESPEIKDEISLSSSFPKVDVEPEEEIEKEIEIIETPDSSSSWLYDFLKKEEGYRSDGYQIGDGKITIGWGHAEDIEDSKYKVGQEISKSEAEELLRQDVATAEKAVNDELREWDDEGVIYKIDQNMYDAMVSIAYNRGRGAFRRSDFVELIKQGKYLEAQDEILKMNQKAYKKYPGLKKRRQIEYDKFGKDLNKMIVLLNKEKGNEIVSESYKNRLKTLAGIIKS